MLAAAKRAARALLRAAGLEVARRSKTPQWTWCGLTHLEIRTILDIGANVGQFACQALARFPNARIISFEPLPAAFEELRRLEARVGRRLCAENVALGDDDGLAWMNLHEDHSPSSSLLKTTKRGLALYPFQERQTAVQVKVRRLDNYLRERCIELEGEVLVKIDVQGYEDRVIRGGRETIRQAACCIVEVGIDRLYEGQADFATVVNLLGDLGLRYAGNLEQAYGPRGEVVYVDAVFLANRLKLE